MTHYQLLDWDTAILGFNVAKIVSSSINSDELGRILSELRDQKVILVYFAAASEDSISLLAAEEHHGFLADHKTTYLMGFPKDFKLQVNDDVEEYKSTLSNKELEFLAIQSGEYSRFKKDPKIPPGKFELIYKRWIENSANKQIADRIFVVCRDHKMVGMVTVGEKNGRGDIGLLAVHPDYRGLKIGRHLVEAAQAWCIQKGYGDGQVVTQKDNQPACALYEKCGYRIEKIESFYHFWL